MGQTTAPLRATPTGEEERRGPLRDWRRWRKPAGLIGLFLLLFALPGLVLPTLGVMTFVTLLMALGGLFVRRGPLRRRLRALGVYLVLFLTAWGVVGLNFHLAETRLQTLVDALHAYQDAHGTYPDDLSALIPAYVDHIPHATLWLTMNEFHWDKDGLLTCIPSPPIGWIGYDFRTDTWAALD